MKTLINDVSFCGSRMLVKYYAVLIAVMGIAVWWTMGPAAAGFDCAPKQRRSN